MSENALRISIIIAAYNVGQFLPQGMDSCIHQTYKNIEIIAVDDGSPDGSGAILEEYARRDSRVKVIHHGKNRGLLAARRTGVDAATGEYLIFLDGDDYLERETCAIVAAALNRKPVDVLHFGMKLLGNENVSEDVLEDMEQKTMPQKEIEGGLVDACFVRRQINWNLCGKAWRAELMRKTYALLGDIRLTMAEDLLVCFVAFWFARSYAGAVPKLYCYRFGNGITAAAANWRSKIRAYSDSYQVVSELERITGALDCQEQCRKALDFVRELVTMDVAWYWLFSVPQEGAALALDILTELWPAELLLSALAKLCYRDRLFSRGELVSRVYNAQCFQVKTKEIKTVGMFYHRLYSGGIERVISSLTPILMKAGYRVVVFTNEEPSSMDYPLPEGVKRVVLPHGSWNGHTQGEPCLERMRAFTAAIRENHVDAVVYHAWIDPRMPPDAMAIRLSGVPLIVHTHGCYSFGHRLSDGESADIFRHQKDFYKLSNLIITLSEMDQCWWGTLGYPCCKTVNPVPFDSHSIRPLEGSVGKNLLWVGRFSREKRPLDAVKIAELVHREEPEAMLRLVGQQDDLCWGEVKEYIRTHHMEGYCIAEGYSLEVGKFYSSSAVLLWTSEYEGMPVAMIESKVYGLPVVSYEISNVDMIRQGRGIAVVPQQDIQAAAREAVRLLRDGAHWKQMSVHARESGEELTGFDTEGAWKRIFEMAPTACWQEPDRSKWSIERLTLHNLGQALGAKRDGPGGWTKEREEHAAVQQCDMEDIDRLLPPGGRGRAAFMRLVWFLVGRSNGEDGRERLPLVPRMRQRFWDLIDWALPEGGAARRWVKNLLNR